MIHFLRDLVMGIAHLLAYIPAGIRHFIRNRSL